jgi:hypothetical protein
MRKNSLVFVAAAVAVSTVAMTKEAHALGPLSIEVAAKGGYGTAPDSSASINPLGATIGGRAGVSILGLYGGIDGEYFFGGSQTTAGVTGHGHADKYGVQLGYNLGVPFITVRPQVGLGNFTVTASTDAATVAGVAFPAFSKDYSSFYVEPGVVGIISFGMFFVAADANALLITSYPTGTDMNGNTTTGFKASFTAHGQLGVSF